jgi:hypothetical protein
MVKMNEMSITDNTSIDPIKGQVKGRNQPAECVSGEMARDNVAGRFQRERGRQFKSLMRFQYRKFQPFGFLFIEPDHYHLIITPWESASAMTGFFNVSRQNRHKARFLAPEQGPVSLCIFSAGPP